MSKIFLAPLQAKDGSIHRTTPHPPTPETTPLPLVPGAIQEPRDMRENERQRERRQVKVETETEEEEKRIKSQVYELTNLDKLGVKIKYKMS